MSVYAILAALHVPCARSFPQQARTLHFDAKQVFLCLCISWLSLVMMVMAVEIQMSIEFL